MRLIKLPSDTNFSFMKYWKLGFTISTVLSVVSVILFFAVGMNYGIDFQGGTLVEVQTKDGPADIAAIRRVEVVGPRVSAELAQAGVLAVIAALLAIMVYIWLRFEWHFAIGAVITTVHDVLLTIGIFAVVQLEFNLTSIAAVLTIVGYSLNDTVVVYDRLRENLRRYKKMPMAELIDLSINQMLSRTVMTSLTTLIALIALFIFGGEVIRSFTFAMIWGVAIGTYSSIFVAAPLLIWFNLRPDNKADADTTEAPVADGAAS